MSDPAVPIVPSLIEDLGATGRLIDMASSVPAAAAPVARAEGRALGRRGETSQGTVAIDTTPRLGDVFRGSLGPAERDVLQRLGLDDSASLPTLVESLRQHAARLMECAPAKALARAPLRLPFMQVEATFARDGLGGQQGSTSREDLAIPAGYTVLGYHAQVSYVYRDRASMGLSVGGDYHEIANVTAAATSLLAHKADDGNKPAPALAERLAHGVLPVLVVAYDLIAYTVIIRATCQLTGEALVQWRLHTHELLRAACEALATGGVVGEGRPGSRKLLRLPGDGRPEPTGRLAARSDPRC